MIWMLVYIIGQSSMSVPLYWNNDEVSIGIHFVGRNGGEATMFRLAGPFEKAKPWFDLQTSLCD
jgi:Asp-tRNA(Asn)/Glu-tRNA(Gln) amidotransferase A subunit family amidase